MKSLRALLRLFAIVLGTLLMILLLLAGSLFCINNNGRRIRLKNFLIQKWAWLTAKIMGIKIYVSGHPPKPPFLLVSNHLSYVDIIPFWQYLHTTFIAKNDIKDWPVIGWMANLLGIVFINRKNSRDISRVNKIIAQSITMEQGLVFFPEGTSSRGAKVLPFKSSLLHYPAAKDFPVHYASISYHVSQENEYRAEEEICWWGDMDFTSHFWNLLKIKSFEAKLYFGEKPVQYDDRKKLALTLHKHVRTNFIPTDGSRESIES